MLSSEQCNRNRNPEKLRYRGLTRCPPLVFIVAVLTSSLVILLIIFTEGLRKTSSSSFRVTDINSLNDKDFIKAVIRSSKFCSQSMLVEDGFICSFLHSKESASEARTAFTNQWSAIIISTNSTESTLKQQFILEARQLALQFYFRPRMTDVERRWMLQVTRMCLSVVEKTGQPYFAYAGTLMGYVRHNGTLIPWDEDADFGLPIKRPDEIPILAEKLENLAVSMYAGALQMVYIRKLKRVKCYCKDAPSVAIDGYPWRWPFIDLQFLRYRRSGFFEIVKFVEDMDLFYHNYHYTNIFPLKRANFSEENVPMYLPNDQLEVLNVDFGKHNSNECVSPGYNHRLEKPYDKIVKVNCSELVTLIENYYPVTHR